VTRRIAAVLVSLAAVIGLLDPFACRWYSMMTAKAGQPAPGHRGPMDSGVHGVHMNDLPSSAQTHLIDTARRALELLPVPSDYSLDRESVQAKAADTALWDKDQSRFRTPGTARADRAFDPKDESAGAPPALEQRVFVNQEVAIPSGLASVGGSPKPFDVPGAVGVEVTTITDSEDSESGPSEGGRVALPLTPDQKRTAITIVRVLLANSKTDKAFRAAISDGAMPAWTPPAPKKPGEIQTLVIEIYGGKADVEAVAKRLPVQQLRQLLD
jgi:hypothetical protein